jgi:hypothetical protein
MTKREIVTTEIECDVCYVTKQESDFATETTTIEVNYGVSLRVQVPSARDVCKRCLYNALRGYVVGLAEELADG